jgi:8-oxo-dGTP pyrophosphatase MutT (NUDIX family)
MTQKHRWATTGQAAELADVSLTTMQRWAASGLVTEAWWRTPGGHLRWNLDKLAELLGIDRPGEPVQHDPAAPIKPPVAAAIVTSKLGVLVERRHDGRPLWTFPAGEIEPGEAPIDTAIRETKEECGLVIVVSHLIGERDHPKTGVHMYYLAARPYNGTGVHNGDENELAEVRWVNLAEAEELLPGMFEPVHEHLTTVLKQHRRSA